MSSVWLVTLAIPDSRLDNAVAAFDSEEKAILWALDACDERWLGSKWHSRYKARAAFVFDGRYGDSWGEYTINEVEVL